MVEVSLGKQKDDSSKVMEVCHVVSPNGTLSQRAQVQQSAPVFKHPLVCNQPCQGFGELLGKRLSGADGPSSFSDPRRDLRTLHRGSPNVSGRPRPVAVWGSQDAIRSQGTGPFRKTHS